MRTYWTRRQKLYPAHFFVNPILNQSIKWHFDYIIVNNDKFRQRKKRDMDGLLDRFFEELESRLWHKFPRYIIKVSQLNGSFFVFVKSPRGKILNDDRTFLYDTVQRLPGDIYKKYAKSCTEFSHNYFPYFKLVKCYGNYHYHFLVVKKDYCYGW